MDRSKPNLSKPDCDVGDDAILNCEIASDLRSGYTVQWRKRNPQEPTDPTVLTLRHLLAIQDPRYNVSDTGSQLTVSCSYYLQLHTIFIG